MTRTIAFAAALALAASAALATGVAAGSVACVTASNSATV